MKQNNSVWVSYRNILGLASLLLGLFGAEVIWAAQEENQTLELTVKKAVEIALAYNETLLEEIRLGLRYAQLSWKDVQLGYKPKIIFDARKDKSESKSSSVDTLSSSTHFTADKHTFSLGVTYPHLIPTDGLLTLNGGYTLTESKDKESAYSGRFSTALQAGLSIQQPLSQGGRIAQRESLVVADENLERARLTHQSVKQQLILEVISAYYEYLRANWRITQAREKVELTQKLLGWAEAKLKVGQVARLDVINARVQLSSDRDELLQARTAREDSKARLLRLLGLPGEKKINLEEPELKINPLGLTFQEAVIQALNYRTEIKAARMDIERARRAIDIAGSATKPTLTFDLGGSLSGRTQELGEATSLSDKKWTLSLSFSYPFFDSKLTNNRVEMVRLSYQREINSLERLKERITDEIEGIYRNLARDRERIESLSMNLKIAEDGLRISQLKYQMGTTTIREVMETQLSYSRVKSAIDEARINYIINEARLARARGILNKDWLR